MNTRSESGFSAVELLVSLIVASLFLFAGYSFYNSIIKFSSESRSRAKADLIANEYLRRYELTVGSTCSASTPLALQAVPSSENTIGLNSPRILVTFACPNSTVPWVTKVTARVEYIENAITKVVEQEVYALQY
jgi:type II secretory pathway component PulJ